jgi:hypothetical protein
MNEFYEKIEPEELEMRSDLDPKSAIKVDNVVKEISNFYCSNCDSFKFSLSDT